MKQAATSVLSLLLPEGILEWFEATKIEEKVNDKAKDELERRLYSKVLHVYLDKRLVAEAAEKGLRPNDYTEATTANDYQVRAEGRHPRAEREQQPDTFGHCRTGVFCRRP